MTKNINNSEVLATILDIVRKKILSLETIGNTETLDTIIAKNLNLYYSIHTREDQTKEILGDDSIWSDISSAFGDGGGFSSDSSGGGSDGGGGVF